MNKIINDLSGPADQAAKRLLGCYLVRRINNHKIVCKIVETEAYDQLDLASHSYRGPTKRTQIMFGEAGFAYVYFTYGMHYCMNVVVGPKGHGAAVLIRAVEPVTGLNIIKLNRPNITDQFMLTNGPAKLCQALNITKELSGHNLTKEPLQLVIKPEPKLNDIGCSKRIGISKAKDTLWRFYIKDNPYVSRYNA